MEHFLQSGDYEKVVEALNTQAFQNIEWNHTFSYIKSMITKNISDPTNLKVVWDLAELVTLKLRKESWAAISAWEWQSWFESFYHELESLILFHLLNIKDLNRIT